MRRTKSPLVEMSSPAHGGGNGAAQAEIEADEAELQKLYETMANTSGRAAGEGLSGADILNCFMVFSCKLKRGGQTQVKHILEVNRPLRWAAVGGQLERACNGEHVGCV